MVCTHAMCYYLVLNSQQPCTIYEKADKYGTHPTKGIKPVTGDYCVIYVYEVSETVKLMDVGNVIAEGC